MGGLRLHYLMEVRKFYWHMYMLHTNTLHIPHGIHISHICHQSLCINPLHLSAEPPDVNNNRQLCKNMVPKVCLKHAGFPDCLF